ncbi:LANO_0H08966g1_1 [Lachancea nothofagi CBS 11611]|uniref:LANO_0H08966g1_1 n=1 Tax=Lachancea nothofagi CBS 11611 TaxID=1266666 RepID=A0A1G4KM94_9SACH|nr:LANO_0H08966g1_1 [Lachancea nothofagi CBS 11611]
MKFVTIPYQPDTDFVRRGETLDSLRPHLPASSEIDDNLIKPEDIPLNRRNFIYTPCSANVLFKTLKYTTSEYPFDVAGFNYMDRADDLCVSQNSNEIVGVQEPLGWRTARCDACIKEGTVYWEVEVLKDGGLEVPPGGSLKLLKDKVNSMPHVRVGISRREASLECPVGFDLYGYGIRNVSLESIHDGKMKQTLPQCQVKAGDRLGFILHLPSMEEQIEQARSFSEFKIDALSSYAGSTADGPVKKRAKKLSREFHQDLLRDQDYNNVIRDQIAIRYKNQLFLEATDYVKTTKPEYYTSDKRERHESYPLNDSYLKVFLNGKELGVAFDQLKPFLPPFSELKYNEKLYFNHWRNEVSTNTGPDEFGMRPEPRLKHNILRNKYVNNGRLGYFPTVSCFNGGSAKLISSVGELRHWDTLSKAIPGIKTVNEVFQEQVADDIVWDIVDEVEAEILSDD